MKKPLFLLSACCLVFWGIGQIAFGIHNHNSLIDVLLILSIIFFVLQLIKSNRYKSIN
jgi:hypothetical protein